MRLCKRFIQIKLRSSAALYATILNVSLYSVLVNALCVNKPYRQRLIAHTYNQFQFTNKTRSQ